MIYNQSNKKLLLFIKSYPCTASLVLSQYNCIVNGNAMSNFQCKEYVYHPQATCIVQTIHYIINICSRQRMPQAYVVLVCLHVFAMKYILCQNIQIDKTHNFCWSNVPYFVATVPYLHHPWWCSHGSLFSNSSALSRTAQTGYLGS